MIASGHQEYATTLWVRRGINKIAKVEIGFGADVSSCLWRSRIKKAWRSMGRVVNA